MTLAAGTSVSSPAVLTGLRTVETRLHAAIPGVRTASYASTRSAAFVSHDGRTTFVLAYPPPDNESFGNNSQAAKRAAAALAGVRIAGAPVRVTGVDALQTQTGGSGGPGVFLESLLGGLGALVVLAFVFASLLALVPLLMAIVSIMSTFLVLWGVSQLTSVSMIVEFLVALIGLGVAIDYSLLVVVRWREERAHGHEGEEAIVRAMQTAGRAVAFSGTTVAIGLLAMIVLPLPFLRSIGYAGMLIPLISVVVATTLLPIVLLKAGNRLDWPHVRSDDKASRSWTRWAQLVVRRRWAAAGIATVVLAALAIAATGLKPGQASVDTLSKQGDARAGLVALERSGIGPGALTPIEVLAPAQAAQRVAARFRLVAGVHGAVAPGGQWQRDGTDVLDVLAVADNSSSAGRGHDQARPGACTGRRCPGRRDRRREPRLRRRDLLELSGDDRADRGAHLPAARAGLPLAAAAAQGGAAEHRLGRRLMGRDHPRLAAGPRLGRDLRDRRHALGRRVDSADGVCVPVRALDGLRGLHPRAHARGVRRHRIHRCRSGAAASGAPGAWSRARR